MFCNLPACRFLEALTIWGSWTLAKLFISDWLRLAISCRRDSFWCSITLFSSSMDFMLDSIVVICGEDGGCYRCTSYRDLRPVRVVEQRGLTCVRSLIMSASTCELDSLKSLISSSSCLISSSCSSPTEESSINTDTELKGLRHQLF